MDNVKQLLMERLDAKRAELTDAKILMMQGEHEKREFWHGRKVALDGTTGEIPFLERVLKVINEVGE